MTRPLTARQRDYLEAIEQLTAELGMPPTLHELGERAGVASVNATSSMLATLQRKGYVSWRPRKSRTLVVLKQPEQLEPAPFKLRLDEPVLPQPRLPAGLIRGKLTTGSGVELGLVWWRA